MSNVKKAKEAYQKTLDSAAPSDRASIFAAAVVVVVTDFGVTPSPELVALIVALVGFATSIVVNRKA